MERKGGKKSLSMNCDRVKRFFRDKDDREGVKTVTAALLVTKEYHHLIHGDQREIPEVISAARAKELEKQNQYEMLPLLTRRGQ
jgi:hypothetical protein